MVDLGWRARERGAGWAILDFTLLASDAIGLWANVIGHVVFGATGAAGAQAMSPEGWRVGLAIAAGAAGAFVLWPLVFRGWRRLQRSLRSIEFYPDRNSKNAARGELVAELQNVRKAWYASESGDYLRAHVEDLGCLSRVVLLDPESAAMIVYSKRQAQPYDVHEHRKTIQDTTRRLLQPATGVEVRWYDGPLMNVVIADPGSRCAWARVHYQLPGLDGQDWPDFVAEWGLDRRLLENIERGFETIWVQARTPGEKEYKEAGH
jgi:hypothetical protein